MESGLHKEEARLEALGFTCQTETLAIEDSENFISLGSNLEEYAAGYKEQVNDSDFVQNETLACEYDEDNTRIAVDVIQKVDFDSLLTILNDTFICELASDTDLNADQLEELLRQINEGIDEELPAIVVGIYAYRADDTSSLEELKDLLDEEGTKYEAYEFREFTCDE